MATSQDPPQATTQTTRPSSGTDNDEFDVDGRPFFKEHHYNKIPVDARGAIRILKVYPGSPEQKDVLCELISGTILEYEDRQKYDPPLEFKPYDALSWCWGKTHEDGKISIRMGETSYVKFVQESLVKALRALRHKTHDRHIWADAICINQENKSEKNHQVEMMADIYGKADCVRIWLGDSDKSSNDAILFIKEQVLQLQHFDDLCQSSKFSEKWKALLELMQREWFSRRWVVQEVALAPKAMIHCGAAKLSWTKFAVAVELFVEVETASHRLSEVMKTDTKYNHVPRFFEYISQLGASLLVDATGKLFRDYDYVRRLQFQTRVTGYEQKVDPAKDPDQLAYDSEDDEIVAPEVRVRRFKREEEEARQRQSQENREMLAKAQPLLTLEYLVSNLSIFDVTNAHDSIYALLGISKDTTPTAANKKLRVTDHTQAVLEMFTGKKQYKVDYQASYIDICKEFIEFCVRRNVSRDPSRALDVICRPFAIDLEQKSNEMPLPSWIPRLSKASYGMDRGPGIDGLRMGRKNADSLVGLPNLTHRNYNAAETKSLDKKVFRFRKRETPKTMPRDKKQEKISEDEARPDIVEKGSKHTAQNTATQHRSNGYTSSTKDAVNGTPSNDVNGLGISPANGKEDGGRQEIVSGPESKKAEQGSSQTEPSTASTSKDTQTASKLDPNRQVAKSTASSTIDKEKFMKAASPGSIPPKLTTQSNLNHFSLFVRGFVLDTIKDLQPSSQSGSIPTAWAHFAGWGKMQSTPPEHFWRTLVADRGSDGKNPPVYYSRACQESFRKGNLTSGVVDTTGLIEHERNSVVAQFCRRVQAAIWNRALIKTKGGRLGLVSANVREHDLVCILYGCSVPVILRRHGPKEPHVIKSEMKWELKYLADYVGQSYLDHLERRRLFREKRERDKEVYRKWEDQKRAEWLNDTAWTEKWSLVRAGLMRIHEFRAWVMKRRVMELESADDLEAGKMANESMRNFIDITLDQIYDIAAWALKNKVKSEENIMDWFRALNDDVKCPEPFRLKQDQKDLWDRFRKDTEWRTWWKTTNTQYHKDEGFRVWAHAHKKQIIYPDDEDKARAEWLKTSGQTWTRDWAASNSWFLCIDSFRGWLREKGKFYGPEEYLDNKQLWEADAEWRHNRPESEPEMDSFNAWMHDKGLENPDLQKSTMIELRQRVEDWRRSWLSDHPDASLQEEFEAVGRQWKRIEEELELKKNEEIDKRKEKARKRDKEIFLERWRKGWRPEVVNWQEFEIALSYGRHWLKLVRKRKKDHVKEQEQKWSEIEERKKRHQDRCKHLHKKKGNSTISYPAWYARPANMNGGKSNRPQSSASNGLAKSPSTPGSPPAIPKPSTDVMNKTRSRATSAVPSFHDPETQIPPFSPDEVDSEPTKRASSTSQISSPYFTNPKLQHNRQVSFSDEYDSWDNPSLVRTQTYMANFHDDLEVKAKDKFSSKKVLQQWVQRKKSQALPIWNETQRNISKQLAKFERGTPRLIGKDGKFHPDLRPPTKGELEMRKQQKLEREKSEDPEDSTDVETEDEADNEVETTNEEENTTAKDAHPRTGSEEDGRRPDEEESADDNEETNSGSAKQQPILKKDYPGIRRRQRLKRKEKLKYQQKIEANFMAKLGRDGQWYYEMLGESYIHGMMDGEAMAYQNNEGISTTVFEIR